VLSRSYRLAAKCCLAMKAAPLLSHHSCMGHTWGQGTLSSRSLQWQPSQGS
jgi:hypothetical protein